MISLIEHGLTPFLIQIFNDIIGGVTAMPGKWLEAGLFFIYKGSGNKHDPEKYRTICIQNPFLKAFMATIKNRLDAHAETNSLFPKFQFGFKQKDRLRVQKQFYTKLLKVDWIKRNDPTHASLTFENASTL